MMCKRSNRPFKRISAVAFNHSPVPHGQLWHGTISHSHERHGRYVLLILLLQHCTNSTWSCVAPVQKSLVTAVAATSTAD